MALLLAAPLVRADLPLPPLQAQPGRAGLLLVPHPVEPVLARPVAHRRQARAVGAVVARRCR